MKTQCLSLLGSRGWLPALITLGSAAGLLISAAQAAPASPVGTTWDCVLSGGGQQGLAFLTFNDDGTFRGYQLLSARKSSTPSSNPRGDNTDVGRTAPDQGSTSGQTNLYGFSQVSGPWYYDAKGKLLGYYVEVVNGESGAVRATNAVSFSAKVTPGKRLTLISSTVRGKLTYNGKPYREMPDVSGSWYGTRLFDNQYFNERFTLSSFADSNPMGDDYADLGNYPGIYYTTEGSGAGYSVLGFALLSSQKKIGFAFENTPEGGTNGVTAVTIGSFGKSGAGYKAITTGVQDPFSPVSFKAFK